MGAPEHWNKIAGLSGSDWATRAGSCPEDGLFAGAVAGLFARAVAGAPEGMLLLAVAALGSALPEAVLAVARLVDRSGAAAFRDGSSLAGADWRAGAAATWVGFDCAGGGVDTCGDAGAALGVTAVEPSGADAGGLLGADAAGLLGVDAVGLIGVAACIALAGDACGGALAALAGLAGADRGELNQPPGS